MPLVLLAALLAFPVMAKEGLTEREEMLEERIEHLERMVRELLAERDAAREDAEGLQQEVREEVREVREQVAKLEQDKEPRVLRAPETNFSFGGYVKTDFMWTRFSGGSLASASAGRDFHIPGTIPVGDDSSTTDLDAHIKETRFNFTAARTMEDGSQIIGFIEFDHQNLAVPGSGQERTTNPFNPRIRHAFMRYKGLTVGQTWSTFYNVGSLPEFLDFVGPAEGTVFSRQPQIRYTSGPWDFAIENPQTTVTPFGGGARIDADNSFLPDTVLRYNHNAEWGHVSAAAIGRQLTIDDPVAGTEREAAFGLSLSGKFIVGARNDISWMVTGGSGLGRYVALNLVNDAVQKEDGSLEAIDLIAGFIGYRHFWNDQWRSNIALSWFHADNDTEYTGMNVTKEAQSAKINLIYQMNSHLRFGIEYAIARRELESGAQGNMNRVQFSTIYNF